MNFKPEAVNKKVPEKEDLKAWKDKNSYERLGVLPGATIDEIKKAYRTISQRYHPDKVSGLNDEDLFENYSEVFKLILEAYEELTGSEGEKEDSKEQIVKSHIDELVTLIPEIKCTYYRFDDYLGDGEEINWVQISPASIVERDKRFKEKSDQWGHEIQFESSAPMMDNSGSIVYEKQGPLYKEFEISPEDTEGFTFEEKKAEIKGLFNKNREIDVEIFKIPEIEKLVASKKENIRRVIELEKEILSVFLEELKTNFNLSYKLIFKEKYNFSSDPKDTTLSDTNAERHYIEVHSAQQKYYDEMLGENMWRFKGISLLIIDEIPKSKYQEWELFEEKIKKASKGLPISVSLLEINGQFDRLAKNDLEMLENGQATLIEEYERN